MEARLRLRLKLPSRSFTDFY